MANAKYTPGFQPLNIYSFPFTGFSLGALIFFTLAFTWIESVTRALGLSGFFIVITLSYVTSLLFFGYLFVILIETARGHRQVSNVSANLLDDAKGPLFKEILLLSFLAALVYMIPHPFWKVASAMSMLLIVPFATSIIVIKDQLMAAMNPLSWVDMIARIGTSRLLVEYLVIQAALLLACYFAVTNDLGWLNLFKNVIVLALFMQVFRALGVLLHTNAEELELPVSHSEKIVEEHQTKAEERRIGEIIFKLYGLASSGQAAEAWSQLQEHLAAESYKTEAIYFSRLRAWDNPALAIRAGQDYITRLVERGELRTAWDVLEFCYEANKAEYRLPQGGTVFRLADQADSLLRKKILAHLLVNFDQDFPNHPQCGNALLLAARVIAHDLDDFEQARDIMARLKSDYPTIREEPKFTALDAVLATD